MSDQQPGRESMSIEKSIISIALLLTQLTALTGCYELGRLWEAFWSTRETHLTIDRKWDIQETDRRLLLVMVHGFNSSSDEAWGEFPRIIKSEKDTSFARFNVLRYGYGSAVCRNKVEISERGDGLKSFLSDELTNYDGMIIMGHSMGGLVIMHALIKLARGHHPDLGRIPVSVMTFGTPHLGVQGAERLGQISIVCTDKQAGSAKAFDPSLRELREEWNSHFGNTVSQYHVTMKTFYGAEDLLVYQDSACGRFPECEQVDGENHVMIVKPSDTNHLTYKKLRVQIEIMINALNDSRLSQRPPPLFKEAHNLYPQKVRWAPDNGKDIGIEIVEPKYEFIEWKRVEAEIVSSLLNRSEHIPYGSKVKVISSDFGHPNRRIAIYDPSGEEIGRIWFGGDPRTNFKYDGKVRIGAPHRPVQLWGTFERYSDGSYVAVSDD